MKTKLLLICMVACMTATSVFAIDYTWTGATNTDYATATNWDPQRTTPATSDNLIINPALPGTNVAIYGLITQTVASLTVKNNASVKLWYDAGDTNGSARVLTVNATSNALNIDANSTLDLGNNYIQIANTSAGFYQNTAAGSNVGLYVANMPDGTIANFSKIAAGQIAVRPGVFAKGVTVTAVNSGTKDVTFSDKFLVDWKSNNITFFTTNVCTGTGTLRSRAQTSTNPAYYPFTVELYGTGAQTIKEGYYKNLKLTGNRANATITMNGTTIGYFFENLDISSLTNYTVTCGSSTTFNFIGSIAQTIPVLTTSGFGTLALDNSAGATLSSDTKIANLNLINNSKLTLGGYNLSITTAISFSSATAYIVTNGTGAVSYKWSTNKTATILPIGVSTTSYDPVTITPGANSMTFTARVGTTLSGTAVGDKAYNAKEWVITPSAAGTATVKMSPSVSTFLNTPIIGSYGVSSYTDVSATLTGSADPYSYSASLSLAASANKLVTGGVGVNSTGGNISGLGLDGTKGLFVSSGELIVDATTPVNKITVAPGAKLTLNADLTSTNGIVLQSDATGTATLKGSGTLTGTVTAQQYLGTARNWYVSSPVSAANAPATNISRYYEYVEAGNNADLSVTGSTAYWKGLNTGTSMTVGKGYIAQAGTETTVQFSGTPNNGNITTSFNLTRDDAKGKGFNLVGNPYPSYLDWAEVYAANPNLSKTYYYRTKNSNSTSTYTFVTYNGQTNQYVSSNGTANTIITRYIPPTQAFWVRVNSGTNSTSMNFTNAMREHRLDNGNLMKAPKVGDLTRLRLQMQNGTESDETLIYFDSNATNEFNEYDSPKMFNNSATVPDLYSKSGDERLVIKGLNQITDNMELPLGFSLNAAATLNIKATELSNLPEGTRIYLLDKADNKQTELTPETEYSFSTTSATVNNDSRFSLIFRAPGVSTGIDNTAKLNAQVYVNADNQIAIIAPEKSNFSIYNAVGQQIEFGQTTSTLQTVHCKLQTGIYVVKVGNQSTRVIVK